MSKYKVIYNKDNAQYEVYDEFGNYFTSCPDVGSAKTYMMESVPDKELYTIELDLTNNYKNYDNSMCTPETKCTKCNKEFNGGSFRPVLVYKYFKHARSICDDCFAVALDKLFELESDPKMEKVLYKK